MGDLSISIFLKCLKSFYHKSLSLASLEITKNDFCCSWFCFVFVFFGGYCERRYSMISFSIPLSFVHRKVTALCVFILYLANLLKMLNSFRSSLVEFLGSLLCTISSANKDTLILPFLCESPKLSYGDMK